MKFTLFLMVLFLGSTAMSYSQIVTKKQDDSKKEAERLWELAIEAKGGRARLQNVRSVVISILSNSRFRGEAVKSQIEHLVVIPSKEWIWDDNRPSVFGLRMTMYNWDAGNKYFTLFGDEEYQGLVPIGASENSLLKMPWIVNILLETKWHKPIPEKAGEGKINSQKVDIVRTRLNGERIDFALDKKTHLPIKFTHYTKNIKTEEDQIKYEGYLTDYINVEGIKMPTGQGKQSDTRKSYRFNVEYNEDIFKSPPSFEAGPAVWKVKK